MNSTRSAIYQVLRQKKIIDYLSSKGHSPVKTLSGGRYQYLCPFVDHEETKPSFVVYTQAEYQNFHCYGCQRSYNIIHLVSELEGIGYMEALTKLSEGMEITLEDGINVELERIQREFTTFGQETELQDTLMAISSICRNYLESVNHDPVECGIIDKIYASLDADIVNCEFENISETLTYLPMVIRDRKKMLKNKKIELLRSNVRLGPGT